MKRYIMVDVDTNARIIPTEHSTGDWIRYEDIADRTCRTCVYFIPGTVGLMGPWRQCNKVNVSNAGPDFGCIHHEEKP